LVAGAAITRCHQTIAEAGDNIVASSARWRLFAMRRGKASNVYWTRAIRPSFARKAVFLWVVEIRW
jgi:hypothetical protein